MILDASEQLGHGIAEGLSTRATPATRPTDPRAVDLYLRARGELRRFWAEHARSAMELLEEAAAISPSSPILSALAHASVRKCGPCPSCHRTAARCRVIEPR